MNEPSSSSPRKAAAARINGFKGGTKNADRSRWNSLKHGLSAKLSLLEARHLPEHSEIAAFHNALVRSLEPLSLVDLVMVDNFVVAIFRLRRALRFELRVTEKEEDGMTADAMPALLRYVSLAQRSYEKSLARILEICEKRKASAPDQVSRVVDQFLAGEESVVEEPAAAASPNCEAVNPDPPGTAPSNDAPQGPELKSSTPTPCSSSSEASTDTSSPGEMLRDAVAAQDEAEPAASSAEERTSGTEGEGKDNPRGEG